MTGGQAGARRGAGQTGRSQSRANWGHDRRTMPRESTQPDEPGGYRWRDPARVSPARLAELAEHDAHIAAMEAAGEMSHRALGTPSRQAQVAAREAEFARLREAGLSTQEAGRAVGIKETGARRYERRRVAAKGHRDVLEAEVRDHEAEQRAARLEAAMGRAHVEADAGPGR